MKHIVAIFLFLSSVSFSQTENDSIYRFPEQEAEFPGGTREMMKYIAKHIEYPTCLPKTIKTRSIIRFIVERNGVISNVTVYQPSECDVCDKEAVRVVNSMPNWIPAKYNGETVRSYFLLPIQFSLN